MIEQRLRPIIDRQSYSLDIYRKIRYELWQQIFKPVFEILDIKPVLNSTLTPLLYALEIGNIQYRSGYFYGKFNAQVGLEMRKIGADFDSGKRAYKLDQTLLPSPVLAAVHLGARRGEEKITKINKHLDAVSAVESDINFKPFFDVILKALDEQAIRTIPKDFEVPMQVSHVVAEALEKDYTKNLNLYIKEWKSDAIFRLREEVRKNVERGFRADTLSNNIKYQYGVSDRKAKFLARQETSLLTAKYREQRYGEVGISRYIWSSSHDDRVRRCHRQFDGHVYSFDDPPDGGKGCGGRGNPGEPFGCRCVAIPLLRKN